MRFPEPWQELFDTMGAIRSEYGLAIVSCVDGVIWGFRDQDPTLLVAEYDDHRGWMFLPCDEARWHELADTPMPVPPREWLA